MSWQALPLPLRLALRELRGGLSGFRILIACIALGVAAIAGVNSVARALTEGISAEGRVILGGDMAFSLVHREATAEELNYLKSLGSVGIVASMRAIVTPVDGGRPTLVELKAVDGAYPHGGTLILEDGAADVQAKLALSNGFFGALAAPDLMPRLASGSSEIRLGEETLTLRGVIRSEPDRLSSRIGFGPRLLVSLDGLRASGLLRPGSLVTWTYRVTLPEDRNDLADVERIEDEAQQLFPEAGWSIRSRENAAQGMRRNIERFSQFLTLVGLTALVVGGVGVANAVASFVDLKRPAIATLKCLGSPNALVFRVYLLQILLLSGIGIAIGLAIGAALPFAAKMALADLLPVSAVGVYPRELVLAVLYGLLVALSFSLGPLGRARQLPATSLFADRAIHSPVLPPRRYRLAQLAALIALAGLAIALTDDKELAVTYVASIIAAFLILRAVALGLMALARRTGTLRGTALRLAIRNIHRPGALTASVVLSLGLGLTLLVSLALIDQNLRGQLSGAIAENAPDFFFLDVQESEREELARLLEGVSPNGKLETVPMLRGRIVAVDGTSNAELQEQGRSSWALRGDRGITYSDTVPANSKVVQGEWWPAGYEGEPLVSLEQEIADDLKVTLGDTITVNILGRNVTARIASLRELEWESLSINFVLVFSPNTLRGAPHTNLATLDLPDAAERDSAADVLAKVTTAFPGITSISVRDAIDAINALIAELAVAVRVAASLALIVSMLVLGGALAAGHRQRRQDAVILKTLGATRPVLLSAFSMEYGLLGLATALFAVVAGAAAAWYVVTRIMELEFTLYPGVATVAVAVALTVTLGLGLAGTSRILSAKPAAFLKNL
jgi:putative ABC transport system permease protein